MGSHIRSITIEMIAFVFLLVLPCTCFAFEQPPIVKHFGVPNDAINFQSNNVDIQIEMFQMRVDQLEKENKLLEERLKKLEERDNLEKETKIALSHDTTLGLQTQKDYSTTEEVVFVVENHSENGTENGYIPAGTIEWDFGIVRFNHWYPQGYSFSPDTGVFTARINGLYIFQFMCYTRQIPQTNPLAEIGVYVNGELVEEFWNVSDENSNYADHFSLFWTADLKANDELYLVNGYESSLLVAPTRGMYFMGKVLAEM